MMTRPPQLLLVLRNAVLFLCIIILQSHVAHSWRRRDHGQRFALLKSLRGGSSSANSATSSINSLLPPQLNLTVHDDILTTEECDFLINMAQPLLKESKVGRPAKVEPSLRISLSCKLPRLPFPQLWNVEHKLAIAAGIAPEYGEDLQVGAYRPGMYYGLHCDERPGGRPPHGGRLATALAYLNTLDPALAKGGETLFTGTPFNPQPDFPISPARVDELKRLAAAATTASSAESKEESSCVMVAPKEGRVITFRNMAIYDTGSSSDNNKPQFVETSTHGACPVVSTTTNTTDGTTTTSTTSKGNTKYVVQQWFGMGRDEINVCRHPQLICHLGLGVANAYGDGIDPRADLASPNGKPMACFSSGAGQQQQIPFLIPNLKATHLLTNNNNNNNKVTWSHPNKPIRPHQGLAVALWIKRKSGQSLIRVGPYEWQVDGEQRLKLHVHGAVIDCQADIPHDQWIHLALVMAPNSNTGSSNNNRSSTTTTTLEIYKSLPGQRKQPPVTVSIDHDAAALSSSQNELPSDVVIGGGGDDNDVDLAVCDCYVVNGDVVGRGHAFAMAVICYDPNQGL